MSNRTYVCLNCHTARRATASHGLIHDYRCSKCRQPLSELSRKRRIPVKTDVKGWKELEALVFKQDLAWTPRRTAWGIEKIKKIDGKAAALKARTRSTRKEQELKKLQFQRRAIKKTHNLEGIV